MLSIVEFYREFVSFQGALRREYWAKNRVFSGASTPAVRNMLPQVGYAGFVRECGMHLPYKVELHFEEIEEDGDELTITGSVMLYVERQARSFAAVKTWGDHRLRINASTGRILLERFETDKRLLPDLVGEGIFANELRAMRLQGRSLGGNSAYVISLSPMCDDDDRDD